MENDKAFDSPGSGGGQSGGGKDPAAAADVDMLCGCGNPSSFDKRGGYVWLSREQWGVITDALIEHIQSSQKRMSESEGRKTDLRIEIAERTILQIRLAAMRAEADHA